MVDIMTELKTKTLDYIKKGIPAVKNSKLGEVIDTAGTELIIDNLDAYDFIDEGSKVYISDGNYGIVNSENVLLHTGTINKSDGNKTPLKELETFPRIVQVRVLLAKSDIDAIECLLDDLPYLMEYRKEVQERTAKLKKQALEEK